MYEIDVIVWFDITQFEKTWRKTLLRLIELINATFMGEGTETKSRWDLFHQSGN